MPRTGGTIFISLGWRQQREWCVEKDGVPFWTTHAGSEPGWARQFQGHSIVVGYSMGIILLILANCPLILQSRFPAFTSSDTGHLYHSVIGNRGSREEMKQSDRGVDKWQVWCFFLLLLFFCFGLVFLIQNWNHPKGKSEEYTSWGEKKPLLLSLRKLLLQWVV